MCVNVCVCVSLSIPQVIPDLLEDIQRKCREDPKYLMSNLRKDQELVSKARHTRRRTHTLEHTCTQHT